MLAFYERAGTLDTFDDTSTRDVSERPRSRADSPVRQSELGRSTAADHERHPRELVVRSGRR